MSMPESPAHAAANWFEIPVRDIELAQRFYEAILDRPLARERMGAYTLAIFPHHPDSVGGCLIAGAEVPVPSDQGTLVYLNAAPSVDAVLSRVVPAGGRVTLPRVALPGELGCIAHVVDPDGNRIGLHALA